MQILFKIIIFSFLIIDSEKFSPFYLMILIFIYKK